MLLNEFLKERRKVEEQAASIAHQRNDFETKITQQQKQIQALISTVQKMSDQIALRKVVPQVAVDYP